MRLKKPEISSNSFECNKIYLEPGNIPFSKSHIYSFFSSDVLTKERFFQAIWPTKFNSEKKLNVIEHLIKTQGIFSWSERLGDLFIYSIFERFLNIIVSTINLYIDKTKWNPIFKYAASFSLSAVSPLFLIYVVGSPVPDLIFNMAIQHILAVSISYFSTISSYFSLSVGN